MKFLSIVFLFSLLFVLSNCLHLKGSEKKLDEKDLTMNFDSEWDASTMAQVEVDDIFTEIADKNLEKVEIKKNESAEKSSTCTSCVPTPDYLK